MHDVKLAQQVQLFRAVLEEAPPTPHLAPSVWLLSEPGQSMMNPHPSPLQQQQSGRAATKRGTTTVATMEQPQQA